MLVHRAVGGKKMTKLVRTLIRRMSNVGNLNSELDFPGFKRVFEAERGLFRGLSLPKPSCIDSSFRISDLPNNKRRRATQINALDEFLMDQGILAEDLKFINPETVLQSQDIRELRIKLYGDNPFPILLSVYGNSDPKLTSLRRQYLIESIVGSRAALEFRIFAEEMAGRGLLNTIHDTKLSKVWESWISSLSKRIKEEITSDSRKGTAPSRFTTTVSRAGDLLAKSNLDPEKLATIVLVTCTGEICNPESSRSTVTGRGNGVEDLDVFSASVRSWTNTDLEASMEEGYKVGRSISVHLCDIVGAAVQFAINSETGGEPVVWSQVDRLMVGSELVRWMLAECMTFVEQKTALGELNIGSVSFPNLKKNGSKWVIDPESSLNSFLNMPSQAVSKSLTENDDEKKSFVLVNAFRHSVESRGFKSTGYITLHPSLTEIFSRLVPRNSFFRLPPMIVPPGPWGGFWQCGYMTRRYPLIRFTGTRDGARDFRLSNMDRVKECMDYLGSTKWRVNKRVLAVVEKALGITDRTIPGIPAVRQQSHSVFREQTWPKKNKVENRTELIRRLKEKQKLDNEEPILLSKLDVARQFQNCESLYFPHSIDFRGRAYPIPAPFNHQGDDLTRALLCFGETRPLGDRGWFWLRIHCANLFGKDKLSFEDRIHWIDSNLDQIVALARDPLSVQSIEFISKHTDDAWQALAACIEISEAVATGNPFEYHSCLPVQQDGSCNGLQHYAALGRDTMGALAVNVAPSDRVEDVYTVVLELVKERVAQQAAAAAPFVDMDLADLLKKCPSSFDKLRPTSEGFEKDVGILALIALKADGVLARRTVKQTIMTICYGVTQLGASDQVAKQLNDLEISKKLNGAQMAVLSSYLARLTLSSIDTVFCKAMEIKRWFDQVASELNKHKVAVCWMSPAGVPCRQPYRKQAVTEIRTPLQKITVVSEKNYEEAQISGPKQRMGFPPNFIHSLDASHMMLTALECKQLGIVFASVHDSFWTHACDVDSMNNVIRQQFYKMYQEPILERLRDAIVLSMGEDGVNIPPVPQQGDLDLKCVLNSPYFFD